MIRVDVEQNLALLINIRVTNPAIMTIGSKRTQYAESEKPQIIIQIRRLFLLNLFMSANIPISNKQ